MAKKKGAPASPFVPVEEQPYPIPENWCWTYLGTYIDFATDYVANGSFADLKANVQIYKEENYALMVKTADFANGFTKSLTYTNKRGYEYLGKSVLYGGELILSNIGSIGKVFRVPFLNRPMTLASNSIMIKCYNEQDYDWLYYFFLSPIGLEELLSITTGTAVLKFNKTDLKTIALPVPPLHEQQRVVSRIESLFAKLDEAKEKAQAVVDGFELRKSAILHKAFTGKLTEQWRKEHGGHLSDWTNTTLSEIVSGFKYGTSEKSTYNNTGMPVLRIPNVGDGILKFEDMKYLAHNDVDEANQVHENDLLIIRSNGSRDLVGKCAIVPALSREFSYASFLIRIKPSEQILPDYLALYLNSTDARAQMFKKAKSSAGIHNINSQELGSITINVPTVYEQSAIIAVLDSLLSKEQQAKETAEAVLVQIDTMKKAILARAFRGELGTNDLAEASAAELLRTVL